MASDTKRRKTNWNQIGAPRQPNATWQLRHAAKFFAEVLGLPPEALVFVRANGTPAAPTATLGSLRADWKSEHARVAAAGTRSGGTRRRSTA